MKHCGVVTDRSWCEVVGDNWLNILDAPRHRRRIYSDEVPRDMKSYNRTRLIKSALKGLGIK